MIQHFRIVPFLAGVFVGVLVLLFYKVPPTVVYEYPHPQNVQDRVYRDKNGVCYKYSAAEVSCDANEGTLRAYPLQT
jgi:hypothetical protein